VQNGGTIHGRGAARDLSDDVYAMMSLLRMRSKIIEVDAASLLRFSGILQKFQRQFSHMRGISHPI
jgi:hypothetical protein